MPPSLLAPIPPPMPLSACSKKVMDGSNSCFHGLEIQQTNLARKRKIVIHSRLLLSHTWELKPEGQEFKASLSYIVRLSLKRKKKTRKKRKERNKGRKVCPRYIRGKG